jgi:hypothetical protein
MPTRKQRLRAAAGDTPPNPNAKAAKKPKAKKTSRGK